MDTIMEYYIIYGVGIVDSYYGVMIMEEVFAIPFSHTHTQISYEFKSYMNALQSFTE